MRQTLPSGTPVEVVRPRRRPTGLVVAPDIMGLRPLFDDLAARLSSEHGWAVAAVEPFPGREDLDLDGPHGSRRRAARRRHGGRPRRRRRPARRRAGRHPRLLHGRHVDDEGGGHAALPTGRCRSTGWSATPTNWRSDANTDAIDVLRATPGAAEQVLAIVGTADPYTPADHLAELEDAGATVVRYEGAEHGFVHDPSAAPRTAPTTPPTPGGAPSPGSGTCPSEAGQPRAMRPVAAPVASRPRPADLELLAVGDPVAALVSARSSRGGRTAPAPCSPAPATRRPCRPAPPG